MILEMITPVISTSSIPNVIGYLQFNLPTILRNKCFNDDNLPFQEEVTRTEIGHLFEHMVLENLCIEKRLEGKNKALYNGLTKWNWEIDKIGVFHISIDVGYEEKEILAKAVDRSIKMLAEFIETSFVINENVVINSAGNQLSDHPLQTEALS